MEVVLGTVNTSVAVAVIGLTEGYRKCARAVYVDCRPPRVGIDTVTCSGDSGQQNLWRPARSLVARM